MIVLLRARDVSVDNRRQEENRGSPGLTQTKLLTLQICNNDGIYEQKCFKKQAVPGTGMLCNALACLNSVP